MQGLCDAKKGRRHYEAYFNRGILDALDRRVMEGRD